MKGFRQLSSKKKTSGSGRKGRAFGLLAMLLIIALAGGYLYYSKIVVPRQAASQTSTVQRAVVRRGDLVVSASGTGTLITKTDASFGFKTNGQVTQVYAKVGDQVEAGQVLAQLDDTLSQMDYTEAEQALQELHSAASIAAVEQEIGTAQDAESTAHDWLAYLISSEVLDAEENLANAQQKLADAQAQEKANPSEAANQAVETNEQAVAYLMDKLSQAQTYYQDVYLPEEFGEYENIGTRRHPKIVLATYVDPGTGEVIPKIDGPSADDIATARNNLSQAQETIKEDQAYLEVLKTGVIPDDATGQKLTDLYNAQVALNHAQSALDDTKLTAPISGTITSLDLNVGEQVDTSSVVTISQLDQPYTLDAYLDEADWNTARVGNTVNVTFNLLPEQSFPATVQTVYPELIASGSSSLVHIIVQLDKTISQDLPAGTGAGISVVGAEANNVVLVPVNALHKVAEGGYAVRVIQNGQQVEQKIEIGLQNESYAEVKSGLDAGETVVTK